MINFNFLLVFMIFFFSTLAFGFFIIYLIFQKDTLTVEETDIRHDQNDPSQTKKKEKMNNFNEPQQLQLIGVTCVLISKYQLFQNSKILQEIQQKYKDKNQLKIVKKIQAEMMIKCTNNLNYENAMEVCLKINEYQKIDPKTLTNYIGEYNWKKFQTKKVNVKLNDIEKQMIKFASDFEKSMQEQKSKHNTNFENSKLGTMTGINTKWKLYIICGMGFIIIVLALLCLCIILFYYFWEDISKKSNSKDILTKLNKRKKQSQKQSQEQKINNENSVKDDQDDTSLQKKQENCSQQANNKQINKEKPISAKKND